MMWCRAVAVAAIVAACSKGASVADSRETSSLSATELEAFCEDMARIAEGALTRDEAVTSVCAEVVFHDLGWALDGNRTFKPDASEQCTRRFASCGATPPLAKLVDCDRFSRLRDCKGVTVGEVKACYESSLANRKQRTSPGICALMKPGGTLAELGKQLDAGTREPCFLDIMKRCGDAIPSPNTGEPDPKLAAMVAKAEAFAQRMCACRDEACADKLNDELTAWGDEMAKTADRTKADRPSPEMIHRTTDASTRFAECYTKLKMQARATEGPQ